MSDQQSKLYWDPLRDDRWDLSLWAWRGAAGDTWYVIRRWCHGCRWLPPSSSSSSFSTSPPKWQHCEQLTENFYLTPSVWSQARWSWTPAIATFMPFKKKKRGGGWGSRMERKERRKGWGWGVRSDEQLIDMFCWAYILKNQMEFLIFCEFALCVIILAIF